MTTSRKPQKMSCVRAVALTTTATIVSGLKDGVSAGNTLYAMKQVSKYLLKSDSNPARIPIAAIPIFGGLLVNLITRNPAVFRTFGPHATNNDPEAQKEQFKHITSTILNAILQTFGFIAAEVNEALTAYLGATVICDDIAKISNIDIHDTLYKEIGAQTFALMFVLATVMNNFAYDLKYIGKGLRDIVNAIDQRNFVCNTAMGKTIACSLPVLAGGPVLAYFFTQPAISKVPGAEFLLGKVGVPIVLGTLVTAAFVKGLASLPAIYENFSSNPYNDAQQHKEYPQTWVSTSLKIATGIGGTIDSAAVGMCMFLGVVNVISDVFKLSSPETYEWWIIAVAAMFGASQFIQNLLFSILPGYRDTMDGLYTQAVNKDNEDVELASGITFSRDEPEEPGESVIPSQESAGSVDHPAAALKEELAPTPLPPAGGTATTSRFSTFPTFVSMIGLGKNDSAPREDELSSLALTSP